MTSFRDPSGVDLDAIFAPRISVTGVTTNFRNTDGLDLNQRYEGIGSQTPSAPTINMRTPSGVDLSQVFATMAGVPRNFSGAINATNSTGTGAVTATITVRSGGQVAGAASPAGTATNTSWFSVPRPAVGNDYDVNFVPVSGTWTGTVNTWQQLNTDRVVSMSRSTNGTSTGTMSIQIRRRSDGVVVSTGTYDVTITRGNV